MPSGYLEVPEPVDPHLRRWMSFIDGENLTMSAQRVAEQEGVSFTEGSWYMRDTFVWFPDHAATLSLGSTNELNLPLQRHAVRAHYYTSIRGDQERIEEVYGALWNLGFSPTVFKSDRTRDRSKGVDIALSTDMLSNAFRNNYDVAVLYAGDGDYVPLVEEIKRLGKGVYVSYFGKSGLNNNLRYASDTCLFLDGAFLEGWRRHLDE